MHSVVANRVLLLIFKQKPGSNMTNRLPRRGNHGHTGVGTEAPYFRSFEDEEYSANLTIISPRSMGIVSSNTTLSQVDSSVIEVDPTNKETAIRRH